MSVRSATACFSLIDGPLINVQQDWGWQMVDLSLGKQWIIRHTTLIREINAAGKLWLMVKTKLVCESWMALFYVDEGWGRSGTTAVFLCCLLMTQPYFAVGFTFCSTFLYACLIKHLLSTQLLLKLRKEHNQIIWSDCKLTILVLQEALMCSES